MHLVIDVSYLYSNYCADSAGFWHQWCLQWQYFEKVLEAGKILWVGRFVTNLFVRHKNILCFNRNNLTIDNCLSSSTFVFVLVLERVWIIFAVANCCFFNEEQERKFMFSRADKGLFFFVKNFKILLWFAFSMYYSLLYTLNSTHIVWIRKLEVKLPKFNP